MKLFLDTNIIMDFVKCREPFIYEALPLIQQGEKGIHQLFISDLTFSKTLPNPFPFPFHPVYFCITNQR